MPFSGAMTSETFAGEDRSWIKHQMGFDSNRTVTLDLSLFVLATHYPNGYLPSGLFIGKLTATGRYGPYSDAGTAGAGTDTAAGLLFSQVYVGTATTGRFVVPMFWRGIVDIPRLPSNSGITTLGRADLPQIRFEAAGE